MRNLLMYSLIFISMNVSAQNLVPNPSFEDYTICVNTVGQLYKATDWNSYRNSPDYFNACSQDTLVSVPENGFGFQYAHTGNGYGGFFSVGNPHADPNYREILGTRLITSLTIGTKYYISFFLNNSYGDYYFTRMVSNRQGILLSTLNYDSLLNPPPINNFATFSVDTLVTDTQNWSQIFTSFIADSAYKFLFIGNFFDDDHTDTLMYAPLNNGGYYFVDDVCISTDSIFAKSWTSINNLDYNSNLILYPNPSLGIIKFSSDQLIKDIKIFNQIGLEINFIQLSDDLIQIQQNGLYYIQFTNFNAETFSRKILILH